MAHVQQQTVDGCKNCGWLQNPAPPNGWLKPSKSHGMFTTYQLVIWISFIHCMSEDMGTMWVKQYCHLHHPPAITIFIGGINKPFPVDWVVDMTLFYPHENYSEML